MANKVIALAGNPNSGKTTLFNSLTGSSAHVGNWPGVTVEKRTGTYKNKKTGLALDVVDLPGIYSLSPYTPEEVISRNFIIDEKPDVVINIIDGTNLERNLYMTTQILEMDVPVVVAVNFLDAVEKKGLTIDIEGLEKKLGVPVVGISALQQKGLEELMEKASKAANTVRKGTSILPYEKVLGEVGKKYEESEISSPLFHAVKLLEKDEIELEAHRDLYEEVSEMLKDDKEDYEASIADERYKWISANCSPLIEGKAKTEKEKLTKSDKIDKILTHKILGPIILIVLVFLAFHFTFSEDLFYLHAMGVNFGDGYPGFITFNIAGEEVKPFAGLFWSDGGINSIGAILTNFVTGICDTLLAAIADGMGNAGAAGWAIGLVCDGCLGGVFAVLGFVPQILTLYVFLTIMEETGYMARVAFMLDRLFRKFGVSGRAFIPMIMGFGCSIPAMMNTRTLASDRERTKTIRVIPFFTCGAKSDFLIMIAAAVAVAAGVRSDLFTFGIYIFGVAVAIISIIVMNHTTQREEVAPFIMELPEYHSPQFKSVSIHVGEKAWAFIKKAFTIILLSTIIVWVFSHFTWNWQFVEADAEQSILGGIGSFISPLFVPLGFGNVQAGNFAWTFSIGSIEGIIAKENVTAVMETLAGGYLTDFVGLVQLSGVTTAGLIGFTVFNMLTIPCFAAVATAKSELPTQKSYKWTLLFWLCMSYVIGSLAYITFEWVWTLAITLPVIALLITALVLYNKRKKQKEAIGA